MTSNLRALKVTSAWQRRSSMGQRKALGRGLNALLATPDLDSDQLRDIDIDRILPNSQQPRKNFDEEALNELADSIREHGVIQPIVVRPLEDGFFELVAGERRGGAGPRGGPFPIPAVFRQGPPPAGPRIRS